MKHGKIVWQLAVPLLAIAAISVAAMPAVAQMTSVGISCSQISALHLLQQENMRAGKALIECGIVAGGGSNKPGDAEESVPVPPNVLVSNRSCSSQTSCTKSESMVWGNGNTVVVNYNDHNPAQSNTYGGISVSTDGGATFTELEPDPLATGHGQNFGDPIVVWNAKLQKWFAGDLVTGCGGQGIGLWTSPDGQNWTAGVCAHNGGADDRESMWVDNEPASPFYGRMFISWNDFNFNADLTVTHSDDGVSWSAPVHISNGFIRDVQITGTPPGVIRPSSIAKNTVFVAAMDEGAGGLDTRQNVMYRSTDGGASFGSVVMGPRFGAVGDGTCGYFAKVAPIIRHMGWGEPAVGPLNVVHYAFAGVGTGQDHGDIFYTRSTDNGSTWSSPIKVNQDADGQFKTQWMPSVSTDKNGKVTISWYDRRLATSACNVATDPGCSYERWARQSADNGATFQSEFVVSSSLINQPEQDDPGVQSCYAGDYDYNTVDSGNAYITWTDGRRTVNGVHVQDVNFAAVPVP